MPEHAIYTIATEPPRNNVSSPLNYDILGYGKSGVLTIRDRIILALEIGWVYDNNP
jgi:hypothetical protein